MLLCAVLLVIVHGVIYFGKESFRTLSLIVKSLFCKKKGPLWVNVYLFLADAH